MIDLHTHILPALDDGAKTLEVSVKMAEMAQNDGISTMVGTPHLFRGDYPYGNLDMIREKQEELTAALKDKGIEVEILRGAEVHIAHNLIDEIRRHRRYMVLNGSSYLFVEFPAEHVFQGVKNLFFELMSEGLTPIIAHPERNTVFARHPELLYELVRMGALTQVNSGSIAGVYGSRPAQALKQFFECRLVHFIATDCHNTRSIPPLLSESVKAVEEVFGEDAARPLVYDNPRAVLEDQPIPYCPKPVFPGKKKKSWRIKLPKFLRND
jgi:protein-tyrosine phosphatase